MELFNGRRIKNKNLLYDISRKGSQTLAMRAYLEAHVYEYRVLSSVYTKIIHTLFTISNKGRNNSFNRISVREYISLYSECEDDYCGYTLEDYANGEVDVTNE